MRAFAMLLVLLAIATTAASGGVPLRFTVTAYCLRGTTASGDHVHVGSVAVDPRVIPLGSPLWIEGYGQGVADDTGGAIVGHHVDVWMSSCAAARQWGRKTRKVVVGP